MLQTGILDPARIREVFQEVLSQPEFQYRGTSPMVHWLGAVLDLIREVFRRFLPLLGESQIRVLSWLILAGTVVTAGYLVVRWVRGGGAATRGGPPGERPSRSMPRDSVGWVEWARSEAEAGRLRQAATGLYQSAILHLDSRGILRYREWKTPGDYAHEIPGEDAIRGRFLEFLGRFLELAFGRQDPTPEAFDSLSASAERLGCPI